MAAPVAPHASDLASRSEILKVAAASLIGTSIEWYDFFLYGTAAALVFNKLFFPTFAPLTGTMAAFATYAVGFAARPIGGIVFGHYGDKLGRKTMLYLTLLIMGVATTAIGLLPTYASIGIWAPILLVAMRLLQGLGIGGFRRYMKPKLLANGARLAENVLFYIFTTCSLTYVATQLKLDRNMALNGLLVASACSLFTVPAWGALSDRLGRRPVYLWGAVAGGILAFPFFWLLETGRPAPIWLAFVLAITLGHDAMYAPQASFFAELFPTRVRYSGASLASQLGSVFSGGLSPLIATALLARTGGKSWPVSLYMVALVLITVVSVWLTRETHQQAIDD